MFCAADKSPCHAELLFSVILLSCSGLKPAHFKDELLFILICDSMQSMLFVKSLICALQSEEQNILYVILCKRIGISDQAFQGFP